MPFAKIADVEIRSTRTLRGDPGLAAFVDGRYIGAVITDADGAVLIRVARCKKRKDTDLSSLVEKISRDIREYEEKLKGGDAA